MHTLDQHTYLIHRLRRHYSLPAIIPDCIVLEVTHDKLGRASIELSIALDDLGFAINSAFQYTAFTLINYIGSFSGINSNK